MSETTPLQRRSPGKPRRRWVGDIITVAVLAGLLGAVYLLPPDTSLAEVQRTGALRACVPTSYPPLVTGDAARPGFDIELLQGIAKHLGLRLTLNQNSAMGRDFNPRNWRANRAQCEVLAGGVVASQTTRSFLDTSPPYLETGWVLVSLGAPKALKGQTVGFFAGLSGLDRIKLSQYLKNSGATVRLLQRPEAVTKAIEDGTVTAVVTEALGARQLIDTHPDWQAAWLPESLGRYPVTLGLWKGDLTLKRKIVEAIEAMRGNGTIAALEDKYGFAPLPDIELPVEAEVPPGDQVPAEAPAQ